MDTKISALKDSPYRNCPTGADDSSHPLPKLPDHHSKILSPPTETASVKISGPLTPYRNCLISPPFPLTPYRNCLSRRRFPLTPYRNCP